MTTDCQARPHYCPTPAAPDILAWNSWSCIEISVSFLPGILSVSRAVSYIQASVTVTYPLVDLQVFGHTSINTHGLSLHQVRLAVLGGDTFLMTSCCEARVPATTIILMLQSNLASFSLHVRHHLDLEILHQLHFSLVKLGHRHPHTSMEPGLRNVKSYSESSFSTFSIISFRFCI